MFESFVEGGERGSDESVRFALGARLETPGAAGLVVLPVGELAAGGLAERRDGGREGARDEPQSTAVRYTSAPATA